MLFIDRLLESALNEITLDVTQRQCRVNGAEVEKLAAAVASSARALIELQRMYNKDSVCIENDLIIYGVIQK